MEDEVSGLSDTGGLLWNCDGGGMMFCWLLLMERLGCVGGEVSVDATGGLPRPSPLESKDCSGVSVWLLDLSGSTGLSVSRRLVSWIFGSV